MKILIVPVSVDRNLSEPPASERFRCDWLLTYLPNAEKWMGAGPVKQYDVIIYQKAYTSSKVRSMAERYAGRKLQIFDVTDPEWIFRPKSFDAMLNLVDVITVSSEGLRRDISKMTDKPVYLIPDRHELSYYKRQKVHRVTNKPHLVWFGYSGNFVNISHFIPYIHYYQYPFTIISDQMPIQAANFVTWSLESANDDILDGNIVLNPKDNYGYKSNNKTVTAWLLGLPVAETIADIERFCNYNERVTEAEIRLKEAREHYDIRQSASELMEIINNHKTYGITKNANRDARWTPPLRVSSPVQRPEGEVRTDLRERAERAR